ncbi:AAA family ATPase [Sulfitobacter sp.]|uniref:AAA family ATPase n=1 Tax=Sulfitobacter sp. TaxID=1903071 RepID=UPI0032980D93
MENEKNATGGQTNDAQKVIFSNLEYINPTPASQNDRELEFLDAMKAAGCAPQGKHPIADNLLHRFDIVGDHKGSNNGAYMLDYASDGFAFGWFQNWKSGDTVTAWHSGAGATLTDPQREILAERREYQRATQDRAREERQAEAKTKAQSIWDNAEKAGHCAYLDRKKIDIHCARFSNGDLIIPIKVGGNIASLQFIKADGSKRFLSGGRVAGGYCDLSTKDDNFSKWVVCEGFATGASIRQATGLPVAIAFSAGNLKAVAEKIRNKWPICEIIIAGDADAHGVGKLKGDEAAAAVAGIAIYPQSGDWNDVHTREGLGGVKAALNAETPSLTVSVADFEGTVAPDRKWIVEDMIPDRQVTLFTGDGGTGKSLIAMQLATAVALREEKPLQTWLGRPIMNGSALYFGAEDEQDEMHRRLEDIVAAEKCSFNDLSQLRICSLAGEDALLAVEGAAAAPLSASPLYDKITRELLRFSPKVVVLDTLADMYPANENDRAKVRQFIGMLKSLAITYDCAVVLLAHPSKSGMETGRGDSGSTAWNGSVRSRLYLTHEKDSDGHIDPNGRILTNMKNNYGPLGASTKLFWDNGVFSARAGETPLDKKAETQKAERVFMALIRKFAEQGRDLNSSSGSNYAPRQFAEDPSSEDITKAMFKRAMNNLFAQGKIKNIEGKRSKQLVEVRCEEHLSPN